MTDMLEVLGRLMAGEDERTEFKLLLDNKEKMNLLKILVEIP